MFETISPHFSASANERLKQIPVRGLLALLIAWSLFAAGQPALILPWLALSAAVQAFEFWAMTPYRRGQATYRTGQMMAAVAAVLAMSVAHAVMATALWATALPVLVTAGLLILCGGLLNNVASATDSRPLFLVGAVPYMAALPVMGLVSALRGDYTHLPLMGFAILLFYFGVTSVWRRMNGAKAAETEALRQAQSQLEMAEAAMADRAAMAAIVSHELRTPVSAILAGAHLIRKGDRPEKVPETAELIVDAGRLMTSMLNDLLDHSKIEARGMTLEVRDFDVRALVEDTARFWEPQATAKGLALVAIPPAQQWLKGDPFRLRQILNNLISNAIKFTEAGQVALITEFEPAEDGMRLRLSVSDQGAGITADAMERLFTPFAQGSSEVARTYGGTGLGLTVSRQLARLMGGDLTAISEPGAGATFIFEAHMPTGVETEVDAAPEAETRLTRHIRVLAVDDHEINRRTLALVLEPLDVDLFTAASGMAALRLLEVHHFDVVLMDVNMPGIDGNETVRRLRASNGRNAGTPVIGFSAGTEAGQVAACHEAGMTDWLPKPLEPARLYLALERALAAPAEASEEVDEARTA